MNIHEEDFYLNIHQTGPLVASGQFTATLSGKVKIDRDSYVSVVFDQTTIQIPTLYGVTYTLVDLTSRTLALNLPGSATTSEETRLRARIDDSGVSFASATIPTPEPSTIVSLGIGGLMGLGYTWRWRKVKSTT